MEFNKKSLSQIGLEKTRYAKFVQSRLNDALEKEKKQLEKEGYEIPNTFISVQGDTRKLWNPEKYFIKFYQSLINDIKANFGLNMTELGIILTLCNHIRYEDNLLYSSNGNALKKKDLCKILEIGHNAVDKYISSLVKKGVIATVKVKRSVNYYMNPYIFYQGNRIDNTLLNMFNKAK
ncbi:MAG: hypothetical protein N4A48_00010 [Tepidibacter sp.]|jgi:DNA-binding MarR family transcriptional regulator|uniref:hypothetical protein n=1 Tax=Tepidibacter sp. TaxID=2529387 RepID=UPI0025E8E605|nr:hypothetical protein [Tepidibacter sp.]MCT4507147.1 hypothetical protein [Tepidibacter sp.]MCT4585452.1 hypothetical protein [Peptostreptococcaceae bacterium]